MSSPMAVSAALARATSSSSEAFSSLSAVRNSTRRPSAIACCDSARVWTRCSSPSRCSAASPRNSSQALVNLSAMLFPNSSEAFRRPCSASVARASSLATSSCTSSSFAANPSRCSAPSYNSPSNLSSMAVMDASRSVFTASSDSAAAAFAALVAVAATSRSSAALALSSPICFWRRPIMSSPRALFTSVPSSSSLIFLKASSSKARTSSWALRSLSPSSAESARNDSAVSRRTRSTSSRVASNALA
mmetsp:Transcript_101835/g.293275  ORF Transcript_101835/g.293275 Transcript_101835/m.293275 type:complete len:247 (+) Transcript_101835:1558-2298(+)